jgi:transposase
MFTNGPVFLIVDGHPVHRAKAVTEYVASTQGRLRLFRLPSSPELNPDEWVWKSIKHDTVGRHVTTGPDDFTAKVITALERLTRLPHLIRAFFGDPNLRYITA